MSGGHREVVHHREGLDIDGPVDGQLTVGIHPVVTDVRAEKVAIAEEMQLPGGRTNFGVGSHRIVEFPAEVVAADRL